ncbi:unnamed protein product [Moneuplotes crassus]|uniref:Uncharacterized protein n=1 Tax=Euplotes crassus TaxID=5936 RepID=A0AAD2DA38_EUPCR|nr:unnamed protein product [Moneuplotes crassus]
MVQRDLQRIIEDQKTEAESEQEENKKMMEEISTKSCDLVYSLQSVQEAFTTQEQICDHHPNLTELRYDYPDFYFDAKRKYCGDLSDQVPDERRIADYLELNFPLYTPPKRKSKAEGTSFLINWQVLKDKESCQNATEEEEKESLNSIQVLTKEQCENIKVIAISFCSYGMRELIQIFRNPLIKNVERLDLNWKEKDMFPKMTPVFCKYLCQFIETKVNKTLSISKFQLHSSQLNLILKAGKKLGRILINGCCILDKNRVQLNCKELYTKELSEDFEEFVLLEKTLQMKELKICNNYHGDLNKNNGKPGFDKLKKVHPSQFERLWKSLSENVHSNNLPNIYIDGFSSMSETLVKLGKKKQKKKEKEKKQKIDFYKKDEGSMS